MYEVNMGVTFRSSETRAMNASSGVHRATSRMRAFRNAARAAARAASLASSAPGYHPVPTIPRGGFASSSKAAPRRARDPPRTASIAGDATREYLVKLPAEEMAAGLDEAQSGVRARLITLTSVGAAVYLGYYIFPLVGAPARPPNVRNLPNLNRSIRRTTFHPFIRPSPTRYHGGDPPSLNDPPSISISQAAAPHPARRRCCGPRTSCSSARA